MQRSNAPSFLKAMTFSRQLPPVLSHHQIEACNEGGAAITTLESICVMLGWDNVPPQATIERNISALKAIVASVGNLKVALNEIVEGVCEVRADLDVIVEGVHAESYSQILESVASAHAELEAVESAVTRSLIDTGGA